MFSYSMSDPKPPPSVPIRCRIYNRFGGVLAYILRKHGFLLTPADFAGVFQALLVYLDDHLLMSRSLESVLLTLDRMLSIMAHLGVPVREVKTIRGVTSIKFLGFFWETLKNLVSLDKIAGQQWSPIFASLLTSC